MSHFKQLLKNYVWTLILVLPLLVFASACSDDDDDPVTPPANEAELLVQHLEGTMGDYLNTACPAIVSADNVFQDISGTKKMYLIDVRAAADFALGHVPGANNVLIADLLTHLKTVNVANYDKIVLICYTGQSAAWATAILRMAGYNTAHSMKYGMSSWHSDFDRITLRLKSDRLNDFVTTAAPAKPAVGALPTIATGKTTGAEILADRLATVHAAGYTPSATDAATVYTSPDQFFILNYWSEADYLGIGHIAGSYQYTPKVDLKLSTMLKTLPTNKTIAVYCYTGQTSANVAAILRVMGYDAKSLSFGTQGMIWQKMKDNGKTAFDATVDCKGFAYEK
jgi:rhodanese-related sulfurtransferase